MALALFVLIILTFLFSCNQCFIFCHFHKAPFFLHLCIVFLIIIIMSTQLGILQPGFQFPASASTLRAPRQPLLLSISWSCWAAPAPYVHFLALSSSACALTMLLPCHLEQLHITNGKSEAQRGSASYPRSHSHYKTEQGLNLRSIKLLSLGLCPADTLGV